MEVLLKGNFSYFDKLPDDIKSIIDKHITQDYIKTRRLQRKANRQLNREHKRKADIRYSFNVLAFKVLQKQKIESLFATTIKVRREYEFFYYNVFRRFVDEYELEDTANDKHFNSISRKYDILFNLRAYFNKKLDRLCREFDLYGEDDTVYLAI